MNISKYGKRKLVIELDGNCTKDELCEAFTAFLNASGYHYTDHIECFNMLEGATTEKLYEANIRRRYYKKGWADENLPNTVAVRLIFPLGF